MNGGSVIGGDAPDDQRADRGQLIVVTALALAVLFVALALILNAAIYTENFSARGGPGSAEAVEQGNSAETAIVEITERVNTREDETTDPDVTRNRFDDTTRTWDERTGDAAATRGAVADLTVTQRRIGWELARTEDGTFDDDGTTWDVATDTEGVSDLRFEIDRDSLKSPVLTETTDNTDDSFRFDAGDDPMYVFENNDDVILHFGEPASLDPEENSIGDIIDQGDTCEASTDRADIDFVAGTLAGDDCEFLPDSVFDSLSGPITIEFDNADEAAGTYELVVEGETIDETVFENDEDLEYRSVVYDVEYDVTYLRSDARTTRVDRRFVAFPEVYRADS
ncbi:MAG: hypothetical protein PPP58_02925 [Natronomonas sp.]